MLMNDPEFPSSLRVQLFYSTEVANEINNNGMWHVCKPHKAPNLLYVVHDQNLSIMSSNIAQLLSVYVMGMFR